MHPPRTSALAAPLLMAALAACASTVPKAITASSAAATVATVAAAAPTAPTATTASTGSAASGAATVSTRAAAPTSGPKATSLTAPPVEEVVAGDIPDDQAFVAYTPAGAGYTIKVPEGWGRSTDGAATVFSDKFNTIRIETAAMATAPTVASVTANDLPTIAGTVAGYRAGKVTAVTRKAGQAVVATYQMDAPPNPVTTRIVRLDVERYEFWKAGKVVIVTLSSAAGSDNVDPWKTVTDGFGWT